MGSKPPGRGILGFWNEPEVTLTTRRGYGGNWGDLVPQQELFQDEVGHCIPNFLPLWELRKTVRILTDPDIPGDPGSAGTFRGGG